jgi:integrase
MGTKVTLRKKEIAGDKESLYLDFYPPINNPLTGNTTRREFLNRFLYIDRDEINKQAKDASEVEAKKLKALFKRLKPLTTVEKRHNKETFITADQIRQLRDNEINKPEVYSQFEREILRIKEIGERDFLKYFESFTTKDCKTKQTREATYKHFALFCDGKMKFGDLTKQIATGFKEYLLTVKSNRSDKTTLSNNSSSVYFTFFKSVIKQALIDGLLQYDPSAKVNIAIKETEREFLTVEELNNLINTDCRIDVLKRSALFSAFTGLRHSDILKMIWSELKTDKGYYLKFESQKTRTKQDLPISEQAVNLMGERKNPTDKVFQGLIYNGYTNVVLENWILKAGIEKKITFHCFRHTYATLQLEAGTDIYTISKMLGHSKLATTEIYAKVLDGAKRKASNSINLNF